MRIISFSILTFFGLILLPAASGAEDLISAVDRVNSLIPGFGIEESAELYNQRKVSRFYFDGPYTEYLPSSPFSGVISEDLENIGPNIGVETIYLLHAPGLAPAEDDIHTIYNVLRRVSSLKGIEYYSASRERMRTFFKEFYAIDNPEDRNRIPDPVTRDVPSESSVFAFQEDLTFGKSLSHILYRAGGPWITITISNLSVLRYMLIPLIRENNMQMHIVIRVMEDYVLFYGNCAVRTYDLFGLVEKKKESFSNRIEAMFRWFSSEFEKKH